MSKTTALVVMAKQPRIGHTKTRLSPPFSLKQASEFYEALLLDTLELASSLPNVQLAVAISPSSAHDYFVKVTPKRTYLIPVAGADIGVCLAEAMDYLFKAGFKKVISLNADGPSLPKDFLLQAVSFLNENDVVLGPVEDGGYYLIGLKSPCPEIFQQITWSTDQVLNQSLARAKKLKLRISLTPPWYDVDTAQDARRLSYELSSLPQDQLTHTRRFFENNPHAGG